mmetsp:Transcript_1496/g.4433  ORF Transcript_1496/g.4433 Transcript_1496/m.4433 type:complete len:380 (+) Transcript_1496:668-1807(+)
MPSKTRYLRPDLLGLLAFRAAATVANAHADELDLQELADAVLGLLAAKARLFDSAKRGHGVGDEHLVQTHHAVIQRLRHPPRPRQVGGVEVGGEAVLGVVGHRHRLLLRLELDHRHRRAESLLAEDLHVGFDVSEHGGLVEIALGGLAGKALSAFATGKHLRTVLHRIIHVSCHVIYGSGTDQGPQGDAVILQTIAQLELLHLLLHRRAEGIVHSALHKGAVGADAGLPAVAERASHHPLRRQRHVSVIEHDEWCVAPQLQADLLHGVGGLLCQNLADCGGPGKAHLAHHVTLHHLGRDLFGVASEDGQHALGNARPDGQLSKRQGRKWGLVGRLQQQRATGSEGGRGLARDHGHGKVPGRHGVHHPDGALDHHEPLGR